MFDFLKKKIGGFVDKLTKKEEKKAEEKPPEKPPERKEPPKEEKAVEKKPEIPEEKPPVKKAPPAKPPEKKEKPPVKAPAPKPAPEEKPPKKAPEATPAPAVKKAEPPEPKEVKPPERKPVEKVEVPRKGEKPPEAPKPKPEPKPEPAEEEPEKAPGPEVRPPEPKVEKKPEERPEVKRPMAAPEALKRPAEEKPEAPRPEAIEAPKPVEKPEAAEVPKPEEKPKERMKLGALGAIKSFITRQVEISEGDVEELLEEFELELLEADVEMSVAESIKEELKEKLVGAKVKKDELHSHINQTMKETLVDMLTNEDAFDILDRVREGQKPFKIVFLGINGAGKTTTIAKMAKLLMDNGHKVVFAASDTFRAAAIEQMQVHADRLDVRLIKRKYGDDPTSVAYDAANYAKAHGIDAVLIDTAGRQDTNISLINEMKKMTRVIQPDLTIYIGESIAGHAIIEQISAFNKEIGIDAVILTKLDCDPKGGTMLSINKVTGIPIIYVGMGQAYGDLEAFDAQSIVDRIVE